MKKIIKLLLMGAIAFGLMACNNEDIINNAQEGNTNVSVTVSMSLNGSASTRTLPNDYNYIGQWAGKDKIEKLTVYLVDGTSVSSKTFTVGTSGTDYLISTTGSTITLVPQTNAAIRTTPGM
jgi:hypothetical protein